VVRAFWGIGWLSYTWVWVTLHKHIVVFKLKTFNKIISIWQLLGRAYKRSVSG